jgi:hypothetical protein
MANYAQSGRGYNSGKKDYQEGDKDYIEGNKKTKWHWSLNVTMAGGVAGGILMLWIITFTQLTYLKLFLFVAAVGILGTIIQWKYFYSQKFIQKYFRINILIFLMYNFFGLGFGLAGTGLLINWMGASSLETIDSHKIVGRDKNYIWDAATACPVLLENNAYADQPEYRAFRHSDAVTWKENNILEVVFHRGLLGLNVYEGSRMVQDKQVILDSLENQLKKIVPEVNIIVKPTDTLRTIGDTIQQ